MDIWIFSEKFNKEQGGSYDTEKMPPAIRMMAERHQGCKQQLMIQNPAARS